MVGKADSDLPETGSGDSPSSVLLSQVPFLSFLANDLECDWRVSDCLIACVSLPLGFEFYEGQGPPCFSVGPLTKCLTLSAQ